MHMVQAWKIAPGKGAENWDLFRERSCIGIGWLKGQEQDYRQYRSEAEVLAALEKAYGKGAKGDGAGAAKMVWQFVAEVKPSHIVVANEGYNGVVGIGVVTSEYLPPNDKENPLGDDRDDTTTHRRHVHLVEWLVTKPLNLNLSGNRFFRQCTLHSLEPEQLEQVRQAYIAKFPHLKPQLNQLLGGYPASISGCLPEEAAKSPTLVEGSVSEVTVNAYERNPVARKLCIEKWEPKCAVCGFRFGDVYGPLAEGFTHVHHIKRLSEIGEEYLVDPIADLRRSVPTATLSSTWGAAVVV